MLFDPTEVHPAHGGDGAVYDLVRVGLQGEVTHPLVLGLVPGQLEREGGLARAGIAAQHDKVPVFAPEGAVYLVHSPGHQVGRLALALVEVQKALLHGDDLHPGPVAQDALLLFHQLLDLLQGDTVYRAGGQALDAQQLGLLHQEVQVDLHVGGGGGLVHQLVEKEGVAAPHLVGHGDRVHRLSCLEQLPTGPEEGLVLAGVVLLPAAVHHDPGHVLPVDEHGANDGALGLVVFAFAHSR